MDYQIRLETPADFAAVENLVREAFWNVYCPGCLEHYLLHCLRADPAFVPELDFVMETGGELIGQIAFMRAYIRADDDRQISVLTMGPLGILPKYKREGYGKILLDYALEKAAALGFGAVCIEGDIDFYKKSGFTYASEKGLRYHDMAADTATPFFLCRELTDGYLSGITGRYFTPEAYYVDEAEAAQFDEKFPPKEKKKLPGQIF